ncbi:hypothetical protein [Sphingobacterium sp. MYb388]|uniref:hypothetical protein n=1 Tax=Sphingobacterium sp. MYb388 TaxID=2745437 RepID=UPI0030AF8AC5
MSWHQLKPNGDPTKAADYTTPSGTPCSGTGKICQINATPDASGRPVFTNALRDEMIRSLQTGIAEPNVELRSTP